MIRKRNGVRKYRPRLFNGRELTREATLHALESGDGPFSKETAMIGILAFKLLVKLGKFSAFKITQRGLFAAKSTRGWSNIRLFIADPNLSEYKLGLYRMRPPKIFSESGATIYGILHKGVLVTYILKVEETSRLSSLVLRFDQFNRPSKYKFAKDRWEIV